MSDERIREKLQVLADAAKYDVSCSSSGSKRENRGKGLGETNGMGICHTFTEDGRCVSLLKILLTNYCIYDCAYCVTRKSNDIKRAAFTVDEIVNLTINFYRRNYIEGLFLSSGIFKSPDFTMERLVRVVKKLRTEHNFNGYIHLKTIPGASEELIKEAGLYADRLSVNIELPTDESLQKLAPEKKESVITENMASINQAIVLHKEEKQLFKSTPVFLPAGQTTQMVVGATPESDLVVLGKASTLYEQYKLKRVYYSGYIPVSNDSRLPALDTTPPLLREHRLYQADWLMRYYGFASGEIVNEQFPNLDHELDPKLAWALRNLHVFPVDINSADYEMILRVPGIGVKSAQRIVAARKFGKLSLEHLHKIGVTLSRARYFIVCESKGYELKDRSQEKLKARIIAQSTGKYKIAQNQQLSLF